MLIMPYSHDQPDNARRMSRMGVARVIQRSQLQAVARRARRARDARRSQDYETQASTAAEQVAQENGVKTACDALERLHARSAASK